MDKNQSLPNGSQGILFFLQAPRLLFVYSSSPQHLFNRVAFFVVLFCVLFISIRYNFTPGNTPHCLHCICPQARHAAYADLKHPVNFNLGRIEGGEWGSTVPSRCSMTVRLGFYPGMCRHVCAFFVKAQKDGCSLPLCCWVCSL